MSKKEYGINIDSSKQVDREEKILELLANNGNNDKKQTKVIETVLKADTKGFDKAAESISNFEDAYKTLNKTVKSNTKIVDYVRAQSDALEQLTIATNNYLQSNKTKGKTDLKAWGDAFIAAGGKISNASQEIQDAYKDVVKIQATTVNKIKNMKNLFDANPSINIADFQKDSSKVIAIAEKTKKEVTSIMTLDQITNPKDIENRINQIVNTVVSMSGKVNKRLKKDLSNEELIDVSEMDKEIRDYFKQISQQLPSEYGKAFNKILNQSNNLEKKNELWSDVNNPDWNPDDPNSKRFIGHKFKIGLFHEKYQRSDDSEIKSQAKAYDFVNNHALKVPEIEKVSLETLEEEKDDLNDIIRLYNNRSKVIQAFAETRGGQSGVFKPRRLAEKYYDKYQESGDQNDYDMAAQIYSRYYDKGIGSSTNKFKDDATLTAEILDRANKIEESLTKAGLNLEDSTEDVIQNLNILESKKKNLLLNSGDILKTSDAIKQLKKTLSDSNINITDAAAKRILEGLVSTKAGGSNAYYLSDLQNAAEEFAKNESIKANRKNFVSSDNGKSIKREIKEMISEVSSSDWDTELSNILISKTQNIKSVILDQFSNDEEIKIGLSVLFDQIDTLIDSEGSESVNLLKSTFDVLKNYGIDFKLDAKLDTLQEQVTSIKEIADIEIEEEEEVQSAKKETAKVDEETSKKSQKAGKKKQDSQRESIELTKEQIAWAKALSKEERKSAGIRITQSGDVYKQDKQKVLDAWNNKDNEVTELDSLKQKYQDLSSEWFSLVRNINSSNADRFSAVRSELEEVKKRLIELNQIYNGMDWVDKSQFKIPEQTVNPSLPFFNERPFTITPDESDTTETEISLENFDRAELKLNEVEKQTEVLEQKAEAQSGDLSSTVSEQNEIQTEIKETVNEFEQLEKVEHEALSKDFSTSNKTKALEQLKEKAEEFSKYYDEADKNVRETNRYSEEGTNAAYAFWKAYEETIKKDVATSRISSIMSKFMGDNVSKKIDTDKSNYYYAINGGNSTDLDEYLNSLESRLNRFASVNDKISKLSNGFDIFSNSEIKKNAKELINAVEVAEARIDGIDETLDVNYINAYFNGLIISIDDAINELKELKSKQEEISFKKFLEDNPLDSDNYSVDDENKLLDLQHQLSLDIAQNGKTAEQAISEYNAELEKTLTIDKQIEKEEENRNKVISAVPGISRKDVRNTFREMFPGGYWNATEEDIQRVIDKCRELISVQREEAETEELDKNGISSDTNIDSEIADTKEKLASLRAEYSRLHDTVGMTGTGTEDEIKRYFSIETEIDEYTGKLARLEDQLKETSSAEQLIGFHSGTVEDKFDESYLSDQSVYGKGAYFFNLEDDAKTLPGNISKWVANVSKFYKNGTHLSEEDLSKIFKDYQDKIQELWSGITEESFINRFYTRDVNDMLLSDVTGLSGSDLLKSLGYQGRSFDNGFVIFDLDSLQKADNLTKDIRENATSTQPNKNGISSGAATAIVDQNETVIDSAKKAREAEEGLITYYRGIDLRGTRGTSLGEQAAYSKGTVSETPWWSSSLEVAKEYAGELGEIYSAQLKLNDIMVVDAKGQKWNSILYLGEGDNQQSKELIDLYDRLEKAQDNLKNNFQWDGTNEGLGNILLNGTKEAKQALREYETIKNEFNSKLNSNEMYGKTSTDDLAQVAIAYGKKALIVKNVMDSENGIIADNMTLLTGSKEGLENLTIQQVQEASSATRAAQAEENLAKARKEANTQIQPNESEISSGVVEALSEEKTQLDSVSEKIKEVELAEDQIWNYVLSLSNQGQYDPNRIAEIFNIDNKFSDLFKHSADVYPEWNEYDVWEDSFVQHLLETAKKIKTGEIQLKEELSRLDILKNNYNEFLTSLDSGLSGENKQSTIFSKINQLTEERSKLNLQLGGFGGVDLETYDQNASLYKEYTNQITALRDKLGVENEIALREQSMTEEEKASSQILAQLRMDGVQKQVEELSNSTELWYRRVKDMKEILADTGGFFAKSLKYAGSYFDANGNDSLISAQIDTSKFLKLDANGQEWDQLHQLCNRLIEDAEKSGISLQNLSDESRNVHFGNTKWVADAAKALGYLGVQIDNVIDVGAFGDDRLALGTVLQIFDSSCVSNINNVTKAVKGFSDEIERVENITQRKFNLPMNPFATSDRQDDFRQQGYTEEEIRVWEELFYKENNLFDRFRKLKEDFYSSDYDGNKYDFINSFEDGFTELFDKLKTGDLLPDDFLKAYENKIIEFKEKINIALSQSNKTNNSSATTPLVEEETVAHKENEKAIEGETAAQRELNEVKKETPTESFIPIRDAADEVAFSLGMANKTADELLRKSFDKVGNRFHITRAALDEFISSQKESIELQKQQEKEASIAAQAQSWEELTQGAEHYIEEQGQIKDSVIDADSAFDEMSRVQTELSFSQSSSTTQSDQIREMALQYIENILKPSIFEKMGQEAGQKFYLALIDEINKYGKKENVLPGEKIKGELVAVETFAQKVLKGVEEEFNRNKAFDSFIRGEQQIENTQTGIISITAKSSEQHRKSANEIIKANEDIETSLRRIVDINYDFTPLNEGINPKILRSEMGNRGSGDKYQLLPNWNRVESVTINKKTGMPEYNYKEIQTYSQLEKEAVSTTNNLINVSGKLAAERRKGAEADQIEIERLEKLVDLYERQRRELDLIAVIFSQQDNSQYTLDQYQSAIKDGTEKQIINTSSDVKSAVEKSAEDVANAYSSYDSKLKQFESTNKRLTGLKSEIQSFQELLEKLKNGEATINEVKNAFNNLQGSASKIGESFPGTMSKIDAGINAFISSSSDIATLVDKFSQLENVPSDIQEKLKKLQTILAGLSLDNVDENFAKKIGEYKRLYQELADSLGSLRLEEKNNKKKTKDANNLVDEFNNKLNKIEETQNKLNIKTGQMIKDAASGGKNIGKLTDEFVKLENQILADKKAASDLYNQIKENDQIDDKTKAELKSNLDSTLITGGTTGAIRDAMRVTQQKAQEAQDKETKKQIASYADVMESIYKKQSEINELKSKKIKNPKEDYTTQADQLKNELDKLRDSARLALGALKKLHDEGAISSEDFNQYTNQYVNSFNTSRRNYNGVNVTTGYAYSTGKSQDNIFKARTSIIDDKSKEFDDAVTKVNTLKDAIADLEMQLNTDNLKKGSKFNYITAQIDDLKNELKEAEANAEKLYFELSQVSEEQKSAYEASKSYKGVAKSTTRGANKDAINANQQKQQKEVDKETKKQIDSYNDVMDSIYKKQSEINELRSKAIKNPDEDYTVQTKQLKDELDELRNKASLTLESLQKLREEGKLTDSDFEDYSKRYVNSFNTSRRNYNGIDISSGYEYSTGKSQDNLFNAQKSSIEQTASDFNNALEKVRSLKDSIADLELQLSTNKLGKGDKIDQLSSEIEILKTKLKEAEENASKLFSALVNVSDEQKTAYIDAKNYNGTANVATIEANKNANNNKTLDYVNTYNGILDKIYEQQTKVNDAESEFIKKGTEASKGNWQDQITELRQLRKEAIATLKELRNLRDAGKISEEEYNGYSSNFFSTLNKSDRIYQGQSFQTGYSYATEKSQGNVFGAKVGQYTSEKEALIKRISDAYSALMKQESKVYDLKTQPFVDDSVINDAENKLEGLRKEYEKLKEDYSDKYKVVPEIDTSKINNDFFKKIFNSLSSSLEKFGEKLGENAAPEIIATGTGLTQTLWELSDEFMAADGNLDGLIERLIEVGTQIKSFTNAKTATENSDFKYIENLINQMSKETFQADKVDAFKASVSALSTEFDQLNKSWVGSDEDKKKLEELKTKVESLKASANGYKEIVSGRKLSFINFGNVTDIESLKNAFTQYVASINGSSPKFKEYASDNDKLTAIYKNQAGQIVKVTAAIDQKTKAMRISNEQVQTGSAFGTAYFNTWKRALSSFSYFIGFAGILRTTFNQLKEGVSTLKEYDSALTTISYTMDLTKEELTNLGQSAIDMAEDLSMSIDNAMEIYQIYANMQTSAEEIAATAKPTAILSNLSGVDASTAADQIQGVLQQFNMLEDSETNVADTSMHVVDVLDKISSNIAVDYAKGIGIITDAVTATGQVAYDAGMSYEELAAITAKVAERTREDGSTIGNAMKTMFTRISKVAAMPSYEDEIDNETVSKAAAALKDIGIDVYDANGEFKDITETITQLNDKWDGLTDAQKSYISYQVAATRQSAKFKSMMEAWTSGMELANDATEANGNALANQEKYEESYAGKLQNIQTQMQDFWLKVLNNDAFKTLLDIVDQLLTKLNDLTDETNAFGVVLAGVIASSFGATVISGDFLKTIGIGKGFQNPFKGLVDSFKTLISAGNKVTLLESQQAVARAVNTGAIAVEELSTESLTAEKLAEALQTTGLGEQEALLTARRYLGIKATLLTKAAYAGLALGIAALIGVTYKLATAQNNINEQAKEAAEEYNSSLSSLDEYKTRIEEQRKIADDSTKSIEEQQTARENLLEIQSQMIDQFGSEAAQIDILRDSIDSISNSFDRMSESEYQAYLRHLNKNEGFQGWFNNLYNNISGYEDNKESVVDQMEHYQSRLSISGGKEATEIINEALASKGYEVSFVDTTNGTEVFNDVNLKEYKDALVSIQEEYANKEDEVSKKINKVLTQEINEIEKLEGEIGDSYNEILEHDVINEKYSKEVADINTAIDKLKKAQVSGNTKDIEEAEKELSEIYSNAIANIDDINAKQWFEDFVSDYQEILDEQAFTVYIEEKINNPHLLEDTDLAVASYQRAQDIASTGKYSAEEVESMASSYSRGDVLALQKSDPDLYALLTAIQWLHNNEDISISFIIDKIGLQTGAEKELRDKFGDLIDNLSEEDLATALTIDGATRMSWEQLNKEILKAKGVIEEPLSKSGMIDALNEMSGAFDKLDDIYADIYDKKEFDFSKLDSKDFDEAFSELGVDYESFIETITDHTDDIEYCQKAFNDLVKAYIESEGILDQVTESNAGVTKSMLEMYGIVNADEVVDAALNNSNAIQEQNKKLEDANVWYNTNKKAVDDLTESIEGSSDDDIQKIDNLIQMAEASNIDCIALGELKIAEIAANEADMSFSEQIDSLEELLTILGADTSACYGLAAALSFKNQIESGHGTQYDYYYNDGNFSSIEAADEAVAAREQDLIAKAIEDSQASLKDLYTFELPEFEYGGADKTESAKESAEKSKETFDWIETKIKRIEREITNLGKTVSATYKPWSERNTAIGEEISAVTKEIELQQAAAQAYYQKAAAMPLADNYKQLVQNGGMNIEEISDDTLKQQIQDYQEIWEKALSASDAVEDLRSSLAELAKTKFDNVSSEFEGFISEIEHFSNMIDKQISIVEAQNKIAGKSFYQQQQTYNANKQSQLESERSAMVDALNEAVASGNIKYGSQDWVEMRNSIYDVDEAIEDCKLEAIELEEKLKDVAKLNFDDLQSQFENAISLLTDQRDLTDSIVSMVETSGHIASESYYESLISMSKANVTNLRQEYERLNQELADAMASGDVQQFDDNWYLKMPHRLAISDANLFKCWNTLKTIKLKRKDEINLNVNAVKTEKINCMRARSKPLLFFNGKSAAKP